MNDLDHILLQEIEQCREEMIELSFVYGLTSEAVINTSKRLDNLLNKYQKHAELTKCAVALSK